MGRMLPALAAAMISLVIAMTVSARASDGNYLAHGAASADARRRSAAPPRNDTSACCSSSHKMSRGHLKLMRRGLSAEGFSAADSGSKSSSFGVLDSKPAKGDGNNGARSED